MQARAEQTRLRILNAALREFSAKGFHGARIDAIATRAKANKERLYAFFGSKEGLFAAVLQESFAAIAEEEQALVGLSDADIPRLAEILLGHYLAFHARHPHFWRLLAWENLEGGRHVGALAGIRQASFAHLRQLYARGQAQGAFRPEVSFEAFLFVLSSVVFFLFANQRTMSQTLALDLADPAVRERLMGDALRLLEFGLATRPA